MSHNEPRPDAPAIFRYLDAERTTVIMAAADWAFPAADLYRYGGAAEDVLPYDAAWTAQREIARLDRELERLDRESVRPLRALVAGPAGDDDRRALADLEERVHGLRAERRAWTERVPANGSGAFA